MDYVNLGSTGLKVSRLCLGMMTYGVEEMARMGARGATTARPFIKRALEPASTSSTPPTCIRDGVSEEVTRPRAEGSRRPPRQVVIATKVFNPMGDDPNAARPVAQAHHARASTTRCAGSAWTTSTSTRSTASTPTTPIEETLEALNDVVRAGKALYIGASSMYAWQFAKMLALSRQARPEPLRLHAEPLQPGLPRGGARDDPALPRGGHRPHPLESARPRLPRRQPPPPGSRRDHAGRRTDDFAHRHVLPRRRLQGRRTGRRDRREARRLQHAGRPRLAARASPASPRRSSARARWSISRTIWRRSTSSSMPTS